MPHRCGRDYTKENGISRHHSAVRRGNGAKPEEASRQYSDVTLYGRRAIFVSRDVRFQDGGAVVLGKLRGGGAFFHILLLSFNVCTCLAYFAIRHTNRATVVVCYNGLCDIRVLVTRQSAWRITPIRFNNERMSPLIFIPNIRPAASAPIKTTALPAPLVMKFQMHEQRRLICILHKCPILVGNGTEYSYSCSLSQYTVYGA